MGTLALNPVACTTTVSLLRFRLNEDEEQCQASYQGRESGHVHHAETQKFL